MRLNTMLSGFRRTPGRPRLRLGLRAKAAAFSALFILGTVLTGVAGSVALFQQNAALQSALSASQARAELAADSRSFLIDMMRAQAQLIAETEPARIRTASRNAIKALALMDENIQTLQTTLVGNPDVEQLSTLLAETRPALMQVIGKARSNDDNAALEINRSMVDSLDLMEQLSNQIVADERENLAATFTEQKAESRRRIVWLAVGVVIFAATAIVISQLAARTIVTPIRTAALAAERVAEGDLTFEVETKSGDELGLLLSSIAKMVDRLGALIGRVKDSGSQLSQTAIDIVASADQQETVSSNFAATSGEIAAAVNQISSTSSALLDTMEQVSSSMDETASVANRGRGGLNDMEQAMQALESASESISSKLALIAERAANIGVVVTTITKVADQTNLLSLNAAIEAEKAGEVGLGFAVVAREIRRLADQTAVATLDIDLIISEMSQSVASGVDEMQRFDEQVRSGVLQTAQISGELSDIIKAVEEIKPRFESVYEGMRAQVVGAGQISKAVISLRDVSDISKTSSETMKSIAGQLNTAVDSLNTGIQHFDVGSDEPA